MVSAESVEKQLKKVGFNYQGWGRTEARELQNIILPDEEIFECVNGLYEGGFALLLATDVRVLLVDKKPLNYLTVEDLRFDMINEIDYSHRLFGAYIKISAGETSLRFNSINQHRLRKLIGHVQFCMAELKKNQATHPHLEQINQQLQSYLLAQYQQQQELQQQLQTVRANQEAAVSLPQPELVKPNAQLADYLYAEGLLARHQAETGQAAPPAAPAEDVVFAPPPARDQIAELYSAGTREVFGRHERRLASRSGTSPGALLRHLSAHALANAVTSGVQQYRKFGQPWLLAPGQEAVSEGS